MPAGIEQRGDSYRAFVYDPRSARKIRKTFGSLAAAKSWRRDALAAVARGDLHARERCPRVNDALADLLAAMTSGAVLTRSGAPYKPGTVRTYGFAVRDVLNPAIGNLRFDEVRRRDVQAIVDQQRAIGRSGSAVHASIDPLRVLYRRAIRDELVTVSPCDHLDLPARRAEPKTALSPQTISALLAALPDEDRALWATAFYAGLRRGELRALRWSNVDLDASVIRVRESWDDVEGAQDPKSAAGRRDVLVIGPLATELARHGLLTGRTGDELVFGRSGTVPFARQSVGRRAKVAWEDAGLDRVTLHRARHCAVSMLVAAGLDVKTVQTYAGHSDSRVTLDIYAHQLPDRQARDAATVAGWLAGQDGPEMGQ